MANDPFDKAPVEPPKPTPGPWRVYECPDTGRLWIEETSEERIVIADIPGDGETIEGEECANARLISAAPDLLAALEKIAAMALLPIGDQQEEMSSRLQASHIAAAALARARGRMIDE